MQEVLAQVQRDVAELKAPGSATRHRTFKDAKRAIKRAENTPSSKIDQIRRYVPRDFNSWSTEDCEEWVRQEKTALDNLAVCILDANILTTV